MTDEQITKYEYCKKYKSELKDWKEALPFKIQQFGCGSQSPAIEHKLERIHRAMYEDIRELMNKAIEEVQGIINET